VIFFAVVRAVSRDYGSAPHFYFRVDIFTFCFNKQILLLDESVIDTGK
jgi:hypothetical protein